MSNRIRGSCLCGLVRFEIDKAIGPFEICHCNRCRKVSGSQGLAAVGVNTCDYHFISGAGSEIRPTGITSFTKFAESVQGFMIVSMLKEKMLVQAVNWKGEVIYKTDLEKSCN